MDRLLQGFFEKLVTVGNLEIRTARGHAILVGDGSGPPVTVEFRDRSAQWRFLRNPELAFAELFMNGRYIITQGTLYELLELCLRNMAFGKLPAWLGFLREARTLLRRVRPRNDTLNARRNVAHHYDLDDRLYGLFLDADRQYSCAYYEDPHDSLKEAQRAKKRHIAAKLDLQPGQRVLDIGSGWGGLALFMAQTCGVEVAGVTLSQEQLAMSRRRVRDEGLTGKVEFRLQDYRDITERFDRIVSIGMFEHVGLDYYDAFFQKIASLLHEDGVALIHTIGGPGVPGETNPFITKYIFPGGYIPSLSEIMPAIERAGLIATDIEVLRLHYAETLRAWRERFMARRAEAARLYDERFCRMWEIYLAGSEACFRLGQLVNFQIQLTRKVDALPITRDYMTDRERQMRARDKPQAPLRMAGE